MVSVGSLAPGFRLSGVSPTGTIRTYSLAEILADDAPLVMAVYPGDFAPVSAPQLDSLTDTAGLTNPATLGVVGLSGDGLYAHKRFATEYDVSYPLLADTDLSVCAAYEVLDHTADYPTPIPTQALLLIDSDQRIQFKWIADNPCEEWPAGPFDDLISILETVPQRGDTTPTGRLWPSATHDLLEECAACGRLYNRTVSHACPACAVRPVTETDPPTEP